MDHVNVLLTFISELLPTVNVSDDNQF